MILTNLFGLILTLPIVFWLLVITVVAIIVSTLVSISRSLKEINEKVERQNTILAAQLKMQYANYKGYNTSDQHTNQEPSE